MEGCHNVLTSLNKKLEKYQELGSDSKGFCCNVRTGWKRLRWEPGEVKELRSRITSSISLLTAFNGRLTRYLSNILLMRRGANSIGKYLRRRKTMWTGCTSARIVENAVKSFRLFSTGLPQLTMLLSRVTSLEEDKKELGNGC